MALDYRYFYISSYLFYSKSKECCAFVLFFQGVAYTRVVTPTQFSRVLHYLSLNVNPEELKLLLRKFQDPASGDVNYPAFVQTVDQGELELLAGSQVLVVFVKFPRYNELILSIFSNYSCHYIQRNN